MIDSYSFGKMVVDGRVYTSDLIIYPDRKIVESWWRVEGHVLVSSDISELISTHPDLLIVGTGSSGLMKPAADLEKILKVSGINLEAKPTSEAADLFNQKMEVLKVGACFHLTC